MRFSMRSIGLVVLLAAMTLALSGCFQEAGGGIEPTQPGADVVQPTQAPLATTAPALPTSPPAAALPTQTPITGGAVFATNTPVVGGLAPTAEGVTDGQGGAQLSSVAMTATAIMENAAAGAGALPQESPVAQAQLPTASPTPSPTEERLEGPLAASATALIVGATEDAGMTQTAVATASGTYVPTATPTASDTPDPNLVPPDCVHVVEPGQTAYRISRIYGVTLDEIAQANGLTNLSLLSVGQELVIPRCGNTGITPTPVPTATPVEGEAVETEAPPAEQRTHLIQPGENLYRISLRYGVTMSALANANGITNINVIRAGDTLIIPAQ